VQFKIILMNADFSR